MSLGGNPMLSKKSNKDVGICSSSTNISCHRHHFINCGRRRERSGQQEKFLNPCNVDPRHFPKWSWSANPGDGFQLPPWTENIIAAKNPHNWWKSPHQADTQADRGWVRTDFAENWTLLSANTYYVTSHPIMYVHVLYVTDEFMWSVREKLLSHFSFMHMSRQYTLPCLLW